MIGDLRNPTLKPRHWEAIEEIIAFHFTTEEPMTLGKLVEIDAFQHIEAIQEVSGRASSEASLEAILKKVSKSDVRYWWHVHRLLRCRWGEGNANENLYMVL